MLLSLAFFSAAIHCHEIRVLLPRSVALLSQSRVPKLRFPSPGDAAPHFGSAQCWSLLVSG